MSTLLLPKNTSHCRLRLLSQCPEDVSHVCKCRSACLSHSAQSSLSFSEYSVQLWTCSVFCAALYCLCVNDSLAAEKEHLYTNWLEQVCTHNNKGRRGGGKAPHILISCIAVFFEQGAAALPNSKALCGGPPLPSEHQ